MQASTNHVRSVPTYAKLKAPYASISSGVRSAYAYTRPSELASIIINYRPLCGPVRKVCLQLIANVISFRKTFTVTVFFLDQQQVAQTSKNILIGFIEWLKGDRNIAEKVHKAIVFLIQDGDRSVPLQNYFSYFYSKSVFKPRNLVNLN